MAGFVDVYCTSHVPETPNQHVLCFSVTLTFSARVPGSRTKILPIFTGIGGTFKSEDLDTICSVVLINMILLPQIVCLLVVKNFLQDPYTPKITIVYSFMY